MSTIRFDNVSKYFDKVRVLEDLNLDVRSGERLVLLGPSGCGKSTILRLIAGLADVTSGDIYFDDKRVNDISAGDRNVAMVFQNYALYPHMSVKRNVIYALQAHKVDKAEIEARAEEALTMLQLDGLEERKPKELSGGQRQRVALARAVVKRSNFFLLDEPLSNLDAQLRHHARKELLKIHESFGQTFIYVTHDQVEAMTLGHRVALMHDGRLQMIDTPTNLFNRPANVFTAKFIGSPSCNTVDAVYRDGKLHVGENSIELNPQWTSLIEKADTREFVFGLRPEHIVLTAEPQEGSVGAKVQYTEDYGSQTGMYFSFGGEEWVVMSSSYHFNKGDTVYFTPDLNKVHIFHRETTNSIGYPDDVV